MSANVTAGREQRQPTLSSALRPFRRRWSALALTRSMLWLVAAIIAILLLAMWTDLFWEMTSDVRWSISRLVPLLASLLAIGWVVLRWLRQTDDAIARQIDIAKGTGGQIHAGLQLDTRSRESQNSLTRGLAVMAVDRSRRMAGSYSASDVYKSDTLVHPSAVLMMSLVTVGVLAIIVPGIAKHQIQRFVTPTADVPPYTGLTIELELDRDSVLYGDDVLVQAIGNGDRIERLQLVTRTSTGEEQVLPMLSMSSADDGISSRWQAMLSHVTEPLTLYARSGRSRSRHYDLSVTMTPQLLPPVIRITPPPYTRGGTYEGPVPDGGVVGLAGTEVQWQVRSNRPLASGKVQLKFRDGSNQTVSLRDDPELANLFDSRRTDEPSTSVYGSMTLIQPGEFSLSVTDVDGIESRESIGGSITILQDQRPVVKIVAPRPVSLATPDIRLPVAVEGADDYGITRMSLFRSLNGSPAREMELQIDGTSRQLARWTMPLSEYKLTSGDEIQLFARIEDNDPSGPKGAESPVTIVRIISQLEYYEMMIQRQGAESLLAKYTASERQLERLAEALRAVEEASRAVEESDASDKSRQELQKQLAAAKQAAQSAAEALETFSREAMPIDIDQELTKRLAQQAKSIRDLSEQLSKLTADDAKDQQPLSKKEQELLRQMSDTVASERRKIQQDSIDPLQTMQTIMPLIIDQQRFVQIVRQQRDLQRRLNSLRSEGEPDPTRVSEMESEQQQLRQSLDELLDDIESHADSLPDQPELEKLRRTAQEFVQGVRASDADARMLSAQENLLNNEFDSAHQDADAAAEILESFLSNCNGMGQQACKNCEAAFNPGAGGASLGNSIDQILAMMGMKPGASGTRPGGQPGLGYGWGAGGGYSQRQPGPNNLGMYGSMPTPQRSSSQGRGANVSGGFASEGPGESANGQPNASGDRPADAGSGQSQQTVPGKYRDKVSEYFRQLAEQTGE
jgi:hypothetical protein